MTALETSLTGTFEFVVHKGGDLKAPYPHAETPTSYISMGFDDDLSAATVKAVRNMVAFLVEVKHMTRDDAYMLCSVAGDLAISEIVDRNKAVHMSLPKVVFAGK